MINKDRRYVLLFNLTINLRSRINNMDGMGITVDNLQEITKMINGGCK